MTASIADTTQSSGPAEFAIRRVGVVGFGHMGHAVAVNLVEDGHQVSVYDRDPKRAAALTGARAAGQLADLAACDVVLTSLPDALAEVALGAGVLVGGLARVDRPANMEAFIRHHLYKPEYQTLG